MIFLHHTESILLTPPKTASAAIGRTLSGLPGCELSWGSTNGNRDQHSTTIPAKMASWKRIVVVRHPLDRLVSMWHHLVSWNAMHGDGCCSFSSYVEMILNEEKCKSLHWIYKWSITKWLDYGGIAPSGIVRFENLLTDLRYATGAAIDSVPIDNATRNRRYWKEYYSPELEELVLREWGDGDMNLGGY